MNVFGHDSKAGIRCACIVNAVIAYTEPEMVQVIILLINLKMDKNGLNHHLFCPTQCCMNGVLIDEVPKFLAPVPSENTHAIQLNSPFDANHSITSPLKLKRVISYFKVRMPT